MFPIFLDFELLFSLFLATSTRTSTMSFNTFCCFSSFELDSIESSDLSLVNGGQMLLELIFVRRSSSEDVFATFNFDSVSFFPGASFGAFDSLFVALGKSDSSFFELLSFFCVA